MFCGIEDHSASSSSTVTRWMKRVGFAIVEVGNGTIHWGSVHTAEDVFTGMQTATGPISVYQFDISVGDPSQSPNWRPLAARFGAFFETNRDEERYSPTEMANRDVFAVHDARRKRLKFYEKCKSRR